MNAKQQLHQAKLAQWAVRIKDQAESGLTVRVWCEQNDISIHTYNYWKHQLKSEYIDSLLPDIVPVPLPAVPDQPASIPVCSNTEPASRESRDLSDSNDPSNSPDQPYLKISTTDIDISVSSAAADSLIMELIKAVRHA